jgi:hypothetical protein
MLVKSAYTRMQFEQMLKLTEFSKVEITEAEIGVEIGLTK